MAIGPGRPPPAAEVVIGSVPSRILTADGKVVAVTDSIPDRLFPIPFARRIIEERPVFADVADPATTGP